MKLQMKKKWKFGLKVADSHSEPGNLQKLEEIFIVLSFFYHFLSFFSFFFIFLALGTWNPGKQWKTMENNGKPSKTKENEKKHEVANEKNMKIWTQSCRFSLRTRKSSKTRGNFHFFYHVFIMFLSFFSFFFIFLARGTWNSGKPWKTMENHQKQRKMKKKWSCKWKKMKIWTQSCRFSLRTRKSSKTRGNFHFLSCFFHFFSSFLHFPCLWHLKSRKAMKINEKQWKTIKNKGK